MIYRMILTLAGSAFVCLLVDSAAIKLEVPIGARLAIAALIAVVVCGFARKCGWIGKRASRRRGRR